MATKNHKRSMSQPERAFWRQAFCAAEVSSPLPLTEFIGMVVERRAAFADAAVEEYRKRVTWRSHE